NIENYTLEEFRIFASDYYTVKEDSAHVYGDTYLSKLITTSFDTLFLKFFYIPYARKIEQIDCPDEDVFEEYHIPRTKIKIETCEIDYPNRYTEYLHIWEGNIIDEKFKKVFY